MVKITTNFDTLTRKMKRLERLSEGEDIKLTELLNDSFMNKNTKFKTLGALVENYGVKELNGDNYKEITDSKEFNDFVNNNTRFDSWEDMLANAGQEAMVKKINNILK